MYGVKVQVMDEHTMCLVETENLFCHLGIQTCYTFLLIAVKIVIGCSALIK